MRWEVLAMALDNWDTKTFCFPRRTYHKPKLETFFNHAVHLLATSAIGIYRDYLLPHDERCKHRTWMNLCNLNHTIEQTLLQCTRAAIFFCATDRPPMSSMQKTTPILTSDGTESCSLIFDLKLKYRNSGMPVKAKNRNVRELKNGCRISRYEHGARSINERSFIFPLIGKRLDCNLKSRLFVKIFLRPKKWTSAYIFKISNKLSDQLNVFPVNEK